jgi:hypothetical protein
MNGNQSKRYQQIAAELDGRWYIYIYIYIYIYVYMLYAAGKMKEHLRMCSVESVTVPSL